MTTKINNRRGFAGLLLGGLFLMVQTASAQIWSSVGSTCTPDEDTVAANLYDFTEGTFQFETGKTGSIKARCHVINPKGDGSSPGWDTLTVGYWDPDGTGLTSQVWAQLMAVNKNTGAISIMPPSFFSNTSHVLVPTSASITFPGYVWDFASFAYYVAINVDRTNVDAHPGVWFVKLSKGS